MTTTLTRLPITRLPIAPSQDFGQGLNFHHLSVMTTDIGIWQHAEGDAPNPRHGYSIDDVARALIVGLGYWQQGIEADFNAHMAETCFAFIQKAARTDGLYHNFCDAQGAWLDSIGSKDSFGRTLWGLGIAHAADAPFARRADAAALIQRSLPRMDKLEALRAKAFCILGLAASRLDDRRLHALADNLCDAYEQMASDDWQWFENGMTYCNARLPHALLTAVQLFPEEARWRDIGAKSLDFLLHVTHLGKGGYSPVGNKHLTTRAWFQRGEKRPPLFDQQPVDAGVLVEACAMAFHVTGEPRFRQAAQDAFGWYFGLNVHSVPVYNPANGGVADAINRTGVSRNQGAESVLSIHLAHQALEALL